MPENVDQPDRAYTRGVIDGTYGETLDGHDGASRAHLAGSPDATGGPQDGLRRMECAHNV